MPVPAFGTRNAYSLPARPAGTKALMFGAGQVQYAPHVKTEMALIEALRDKKLPDNDAVAGVVEMLGRAGSTNALPYLQEALKNHEPVVRTAAAVGLGFFLDGLHADSHLRVDIGQALADAFKDRLAALQTALEDEKTMERAAPEIASLEDTDTWLKRMEKREEDTEKRNAELAMLAKALGKAGTQKSQYFLKTLYQANLAGTEQAIQNMKMWERSMLLAEEKFREKLEKDFERPYEELVKDWQPERVQRMRDEFPVHVSQTSKPTMKESRTEYYHSIRGVKLLEDQGLAMIQGLAVQRDPMAISLLKKSAASSCPEIAGKALEAVAPFNVLDYETEIAANLVSAEKAVRKGALKALIACNNPDAKERLMDFLHPIRFFSTMGPPTTYLEFQEIYDAYVQFLMGLAVRGDAYIDTLTKRAEGRDYDYPSRDFSMMILALMHSKYMARKVTPQTLAKSKNSIVKVARTDNERTAQGKVDMMVTATAYWADIKETPGLIQALNMINSPQCYLKDWEKSWLLYSVHEALLFDHDLVRQDQYGANRDDVRYQASDRLSHKILSVMERSLSAESDTENGSGENLPVTASMISEKRATLEPDAWQVLNGEKSGDALTALAYAYKRNVTDTDFVKLAKENLNFLRPILSGLVVDPENKESLSTRVFSAKILGVLADKESVDLLIDQVRDPFKGKHRWFKHWAHPRPTDPVEEAKVIRYHCAKALGQIGDSKAVDVMMELMDGPDLPWSLMQDEVPGQLAEDLNRKLKEVEVGLGALDKQDAETSTPDLSPGVQQDLFPRPLGPTEDSQRLRKELTEMKTEFQRRLQKVHDTLDRVMREGRSDRRYRTVRIGAANCLMQYEGGLERLKKFIAETPNPNFRRQAVSALISNDYALTPEHPDHALVQKLTYPGLGVEKLHARGITGKGTDLAVVDGGYVYTENQEGFQDRVKVPPSGMDETTHTHPTMVATTAAGNGVLKGVAPEATVYSDHWPDNDQTEPDEIFDRYKKLIKGKLRGENNIQVINNSWSMTMNQVVFLKSFRRILKEFRKVVAAAEAAGIQFVFSGGNDREKEWLPGIGTLNLFAVDVDKLTDEEREDMSYLMENILLVGASNTQGFDDDVSQHVLTEFSSIADSTNPKLKPTVVAPGADMMVYDYEKKRLKKSLVNGTSFSGPYVAGLVALLSQVDPKLTPADKRDIIIKTSRPLPGLPDNLQGHGEVDPIAAVEMAKTYRKQKKQAAKQATAQKAL